MPPRASVAASTNAVAPAASDTSPTMGTAPGTLPAASSRRSGSRPFITTRHPSSASATAVARPKPAEEARHQRPSSADS